MAVGVRASATQDVNVDVDVDLDDYYPPLFYGMPIEIPQKPLIKRKNMKKSVVVIENRENVDCTGNLEYTDNHEFHSFASANSIFGSLIADMAHCNSSSNSSSSSSRSSSSSGNNSDGSGSGVRVNGTSVSGHVRCAKRRRSDATTDSVWWFDQYALESQGAGESTMTPAEKENENGECEKRREGGQGAGLARKGLS